MKVVTGELAVLRRDGCGKVSVPVKIHRNASASAAITMSSISAADDLLETDSDLLIIKQKHPPSDLSLPNLHRQPHHRRAN